MELILQACNKIFTEKKLLRVYPELESETNDYLKLLKNSPKTKESYRKWFEIPIKIGFFDGKCFLDEEYLLKWDIFKIQKYIENKKIKSQKIQVENEDICSCSSNLNESKLSEMKSIPEIEKPIILAHHSGIQKFIVIDGNHRFHVAKDSAKKQIKAVILYPNTHLNYMSEKNKNQFIVHHNLFVLINYADSPLRRKCILSNDFNKESLYPILNKNYIFSKFRRLKYLLMKK